jgi:formiminotetrahydrofolate cyclodeaminase
MVRSGELANEDSEAFDSVVAGFKMPKSSEEEKDARRQSIRLATLRAAEVPLATSQHGMDLLNVLADLATHGNANAASDVGVASLLASAAVKGGLFNVDINVASLPAEMSQPVIEQCSGMREECSRVSRLVMHAVHDRINS